MNKNKRKIYNGMSGIAGYFIGTILYDLFFKKVGSNNSLFKIIIILVVALSISKLSAIYLNYRHPETTTDTDIEETDERGQFIRGKSSIYTLLFIAALSLILFTYAYFKGYLVVSYMIAAGYVLTLVFNKVIQSILDKRY